MRKESHANNSVMSEATKRLLPLIAPLTAKELKVAAAAAKKHFQEELSERHIVFSPELRIEKPGRPDEKPVRAIAVLALDYMRDRTVEILLDAGCKVLRSTVIEGYQPAFTAEEISEARRIAEADGGVAAIATMKGVFVSPFGPHREEAQGSRQVGLHYAVREGKRQARLLGDAVVNLSTGKLVSFERESPAGRGEN